MQRFSGSWMARFAMILFGLCGLGSTYFMLWPVPQAMSRSSENASMLVVGILFGIGSLLVGLACFWGLVDSFTVYTLDDEKIIKRAIYGTYEMAWKYVTDIKVGGRQAIAIVLTDDAGRRMRVISTLMENENGLRAAIEEHLKPLREKQAQEMDWQEKTFRPMGSLRYIFLAGTFLWILMMLGFLVAPGQLIHPPSSAWIMVVFMALFAIPTALVCLYAWTWTIVISRGVIISRSLFFHRALSFRQIESVMERDMPVKNGTILETTVQGAGQTIKFNEMMPDYALVRDYIQAQAGKEAVERGEAQVPVENKKWLRSQMIQITLISLIAGGGLAAFFLTTAYQRLEIYDRLDHQGAHTVGQITGTRISGGRSTTYLIDYTFRVNGQTYRHSSPITRRDYEAAQPDRPIEIIYLPNDPNTSRAQQSIGRKDVESMLRLAYGMLALIILLPPGAYFDLRKRLNKRQAAKGKG